MKKLSFILIAVIFFAAEVFPQWIHQTTPSSNALSAISVVNPNVIFAAGDYETIIKTTNGGINWIKLRENLAGKDYLGIHFINENTGIAVGGLFTPIKIGIISRTTNGGANWTDFTSTDGCFRALYFVNSTTGYLGGWVNSAAISPVLKTTNAGLNWLAAPAFNCYGVEDFHFINNNTGWATGDVSGGQALFKTVNGGYTWTLLSNFGGSVWLCSVFFINENTGWVTGNQSTPWGGLLRKTTNGGLNWTPQVHANTNELYEIQFINENTGWVAGDSPHIQKTTNGGTNWYTQTTPSTWWMWDIHFINDNTGWAAGSQGKIFHTTNGGGPVSVQNISTEVPSEYSLSQNYPNPFNPETKIRFSIKKTENRKQEVPVCHSR
ncbi:MAG: YCF48-related protein, partial [Ignavibacteria bacterium]|nr:YCF48-related protein [Ignavibacteria bacterium]